MGESDTRGYVPSPFMFEAVLLYEGYAYEISIVVSFKVSLTRISDRYFAILSTFLSIRLSPSLKVVAAPPASILHFAPSGPPSHVYIHRISTEELLLPLTSTYPRSPG